MAKIVPIGPPANDSERLAIAHLRDHLPDSYTILHNFEITPGSETFEIDLAVLAPHSVFIVDVKGTHGHIDVYKAKWYPHGRQPYHSPLAKLRQHAKVIKSLICASNPARKELENIHVHAAVLLTATDAAVFDPEGIDGKDVTHLNKCVGYFQGKSHIPSHRSTDIAPLLHLAEKAIRGKARPKSSPVCYRDWQVEEKLGGDDHYTEYRARHTFMGKSGGRARLRVYRADPYQEKAARDAEKKRISNAYRAVAHMPPHPSILTVREFFATEDEDHLVLVTEDISGQALRQHIKKATLALTYDQKLRIIREILTALNHAHRHGVIHRNLTPDAILVTTDGHARVAAFDYARVGKDRTSTIAEEIVDDLDPLYQAPECYRDPKKASIASDLFSAGLIFFELLTGEQAFENNERVFDLDAKFPVKPSELRPELPAELDGWLQKHCMFDPEDRFASAAVARRELLAIISPEVHKKNEGVPALEPPAPAPENLTDLPHDYVLGTRFVVQERLGSPGGFGVAYKVFDTLGEVIRVLKLITRDRRSVYERLRREYTTLAKLPEHPHVVKVIWADKLPDDTPYIVFEFVDGFDVNDMIEARALSVEDAMNLVRQTALGLQHLHQNGVYHQDIKPSNLLWTASGVRIIDFNVAARERDEAMGGGGTRRYIPPDYEHATEPSASDRMDRDLYALGITFYECITGQYPFDDPVPPPKTAPRDPRELSGFEDLSQELVELMLKMVAPSRADRFPGIDQFFKAVIGIKSLRKPVEISKEITTGASIPAALGLEPARPNFNPFVHHLLTLYSQSRLSNAGTRGLDAVGELTYVSTLLDEKLRPALLAGHFRLVLISGNAGDGKTAFIQKFERYAETEGAELHRGLNGAIFKLGGRTFQSNYDGSQDEGEERNDAVLLKFFAPFTGEDENQWPKDQTRIIAINEGRLVDFLMEHEKSFPLLSKTIQDGLAGGGSVNGIAAINLNLRSVVTAQNGVDSIFERLIRGMTREELWQPCKSCDLKDRCYAYHNARTFMEPVAGPKVVERLKMLYLITHLRGRLHITLRDLRSALAFMLIGTLDCDAIHSLYNSGSQDALRSILGSFYFNAWIGGYAGSEDRLISLLREIDTGEVSDPALDRIFSFLDPDAKEMSRFSFAERGHYDDTLIKKLFTSLPREHSGRTSLSRVKLYREYVSILRRRFFFERRDKGWVSMLPYRSVHGFLSLVMDAESDQAGEVRSILEAINRGEGLSDPARLGNQLALRVRQVERGTVRSYRLFDGNLFSLARVVRAGELPFVEHLPQQALLQYRPATGHNAELGVNLDIYEMLTRINEGYRPNIEELKGFYLSLAVFENVLASAPYREVMLTETGYDFFKVSRDDDGVLHLEKVQGGEC